MTPTEIRAWNDGHDRALAAHLRNLARGEAADLIDARKPPRPRPPRAQRQHGGDRMWRSGCRCDLCLARAQRRLADARHAYAARKRINLTRPAKDAA